MALAAGGGPRSSASVAWRSRIGPTTRCKLGKTSLNGPHIAGFCRACWSVSSRPRNILVSARTRHVCGSSLASGNVEGKNVQSTARRAAGRKRGRPLASRRKRNRPYGRIPNESGSHFLGPGLSLTGSLWLRLQRRRKGRPSALTARVPIAVLNFVLEGLVALPRRTAPVARKFLLCRRFSRQGPCEP